MELERRTGMAARASGKKIEGRAIAYNCDSELLGGMLGFVERIAPGAFSQSLRTADLVGLVDHDTSKVLGRRSAGTLDFTDSLDGLDVSITPPDTTYGRDLMVSLDRNDIGKMSFGFYVTKDVWSLGADGKTPVRTVLLGDIVEVSCVAFPAYPQTSAAARSLSLGMRRQNRVMTLNQGGFEAASEAIAAGRIDEGEWSFGSADADALLGEKMDWLRFGAAHLAEVPSETMDTRERWAYPWGKLADGKMTIFSRAVSAALARSADGHPEIHEAAAKLKAAIDKKLGEKGDRSMEILELQQRLALGR